MSDWQPIETAPKDGTTVRLGWIVNQHVEFQVNSRWLGDRWDGDWTPTHWRLLPEPPANSVEDEMIGQPKIETGVPDKEVIRRLVRQTARLVLDLDSRNRRIAALETKLAVVVEGLEKLRRVAPRVLGARASEFEPMYWADDIQDLIKEARS